MINQSDQTFDEKETDREERDRATGNRSLLGTDLCQRCGSPDGRRIVWDDPEDPDNHGFTRERCPECNPDV